MGATVTCLCPPSWTGSACDVPNVTCAVAAARRGQVWGTGDWEDWELWENGVPLPVCGTGSLENRIPYRFGGLGGLEGAWMLGFLPSLGYWEDWESGWMPGFPPSLGYWED